MILRLAVINLGEIKLTTSCLVGRSAATTVDGEVTAKVVRVTNVRSRTLLQAEVTRRARRPKCAVLKRYVIDG